MQDTRHFGSLTVRLGGVPPVYDPGGATWIVTGKGVEAEYREMQAAAVREHAVQIVVPQGDPDVLEPLGYRAMSTFWRGSASGGGSASTATESDLEFILELAAARRAAYAAIEPVFWREAETARVLQRDWFRHLMQDADARVLRDPEGFLIATPREGEWFVDDFVMSTPEAWGTAGRRLLTTLSGRVLVVCACHDAPKQILLRSLGCDPAFQWFQKSLGEEEE